MSPFEPEELREHLPKPPGQGGGVIGVGWVAGVSGGVVVGGAGASTVGVDAVGVKLLPP